MADYLRSAELLGPITQRERRTFVERGGDGALYESLAGVRRENLEAAFDEMHHAYGSVDDYFENGLGIDVSTCDALRSSFVERPSG